jgi:hypothetical protein
MLNQQDSLERFQFAKIRCFHHHTKTCQTQHNNFIKQCFLYTKHPIQLYFKQKLQGYIFNYFHQCQNLKQTIKMLA